MATEKELKLLEKLFNESPAGYDDLAGIEDEAFTKLIFPRVFPKTLQEKDYKSIVNFIADDNFGTDAAALVKLHVEGIRSYNWHYETDRLRAEFQGGLLQAASKKKRESVIAVFPRDYMSQQLLSPEEERSAILRSDDPYELIRFINANGFDKAVAKNLIAMGLRGRLNLVDDENLQKILALVSTAEETLAILKGSSVNFMTELLPTIGYLDKQVIYSLLGDARNTTNFLEVLEALRLNPLAQEAIDELDKIEGEHKPGRPSLDEVEAVKKARKSLVRREMQRETFDDIELTALSYEAPLKSKETALKKAVISEESGTLTDPFKVTELEGLVLRIKEFVKARAQLSFVVSQN